MVLKELNISLAENSLTTQTPKYYANNKYHCQRMQHYMILYRYQYYMRPSSKNLYFLSMFSVVYKENTHYCLQRNKNKDKRCLDIFGSVVE